jgi:hypothetical protein
MSTVSADPPHFDSVTPDLDGSLTAYSYFTPSEPVLRDLVAELFGKNWAHITVGPCIEGAVFEIRFTQAPEIRISDGYLTVDLGPWHFHLCIGAHTSSSSEELRKLRPVNKIAFFERRGKGCGGGRSWGMRLWNGYGEQNDHHIPAKSQPHRRYAVHQNAGLEQTFTLLSPAQTISEGSDS